MKLNSKVVVITGASSGIGAATAVAFAGEGCRLVIAARNMERLQEVKERCMELGAEVLACVCDVSKEQDCFRLMELTVKKFKGIDILINNAGISMRAIFADTDLSVLKKIMDVNFWGTVYCTRLAIPYILHSKGSIIAVSSIAGIKGLPGRTGYSASKFAVNGFMEALRIENSKKHIHVGVIYPGYTTSNIRNTALNKDGNEQAETPFEEEKLMPASVVATEIVQMVRERKPESVLTSQGKITFWINKFFPRFLDTMVYKTIAKEKDSPFK